MEAPTRRILKTEVSLWGLEGLKWGKGWVPAAILRIHQFWFWRGINQGIFFFSIIEKERGNSVYKSEISDE